MKKYTTEEIKNRLSNIGEAIGVIALEYIEKLEKENEQLKAQNEEMKNCYNCSNFCDRNVNCSSICIRNNPTCLNLKDFWKMKDIY